MMTTYGEVSAFGFKDELHFIIPATTIAVVCRKKTDRENVIIRLMSDGTIRGDVTGRWFPMSHRIVDMKNMLARKQWVLPDEWLVGWFDDTLKEVYGDGYGKFKWVADGYMLYRNALGFFTNKTAIDGNYDLVVIDSGPYHVTAAHKGVPTLFKRRFHKVSGGK